MWRLFLKNKFVEIMNFIYECWTDNEVPWVTKSLAIVVAGCIPGTWVGYEFLMRILSDANETATILVLILAFLVYVCAVFIGLGVYYLIKVIFQWLKDNYQEAKEGKEVKFRWKE